MFRCIETNLETETLEDAIGFCVGGVFDGEPIELAGICDGEDTDCFEQLSDNAEECAAAIAAELD